MFRFFRICLVAILSEMFVPFNVHVFTKSSPLHGSNLYKSKSSQFILKEYEVAIVKTYMTTAREPSIYVYIVLRYIVPFCYIQKLKVYLVQTSVLCESTSKIFIKFDWSELLKNRKKVVNFTKDLNIDKLQQPYFFIKCNACIFQKSFYVKYLYTVSCF